MAADRLHLSWSDVEELAAAIARRHHGASIDAVFGIPQGGYPVATLVGQELGVPVILRDPRGGDDSWRVALGPRMLVVDDLVDSGRTVAPYLAAGCRVDALVRKPHTPQPAGAGYNAARTVDQWVVFPWERATGPDDAVVRILEHIGEDPTRPGIIDTPRRVIKAYEELTSGYQVDVAALLDVTFDEQVASNLVVSAGIPFASLCEHHLLPFTGTVAVGYIPAGGVVVGLSKLARVVEAFARRLQVQERMTEQIAEAIEHHLKPAGVGVVVEASHTCQAMRGVRKPGWMVTSALRGILMHSPSARAEFLSIARER